MEITRPPDEFRSKPKKDPISDEEELEQKRQELLQQLSETNRELSRLNPTQRSEAYWERQEMLKKPALPKAFRNQKDYQTNGKIPPPPPPPPAPEGPPNVLITEGKPSFPKGRIVPESPIVSKITSWLDRKWFESRPNAEP